MPKVKDEIKREETIDIDFHSLNRSIVSGMKPLTKSEINEAYSKIKKWFESKECEYIAFFAHKARNFTIFHIEADDSTKFINELKLAISNRGVIKEFYINPATGGVELWIDDVFYALFPYDEGVIKIG